MQKHAVEHGVQQVVPGCFALLLELPAQKIGVEPEGVPVRRKRPFKRARLNPEPAYSGGKEVVVGKYFSFRQGDNLKSYAVFLTRCIHRAQNATSPFSSQGFSFPSSSPK